MKYFSKTYYVKTFGCQANEADSEKIAGWYESKGWKPAKTISEADEVIINTCSVRQTAEDRVYGLVNNLMKVKGQKPRLRASFAEVATKAEQGFGLRPTKSPSADEVGGQAKIILTGCMLYHGISWLRKRLPQVDEFRHIREFKSLSSNIYHPSSAFVPIMEGCDHFCSYCVVPYARGRERSRPISEVVCEVEELARRGSKEITLLGQNVNSYQPSFAKLLRVLHKIPGLKKISFMTSNPWDLTDEIIGAMALPKIDRYLHLPVQSGDDDILKKMNRPYTAKVYFELVKKIRKKIPEVKIGTDIIVGFPGETEEQFENTVDLCKKAGFVKAYISRYSPRPGTSAFRLKDDIPSEEKKRRWRILEELINK